MLIILLHGVDKRWIHIHGHVHGMISFLNSLKVVSLRFLILVELICLQKEVEVVEGELFWVLDVRINHVLGDVKIVIV